MILMDFNNKFDCFKIFNFGNLITTSYGFCVKILKFTKHLGWNTGVQVGKFLEFNKICCTVIQENTVRHKVSTNVNNR